MRKIPSSPSMTAVGVSTSAAKSASLNASSSWLDSAWIQPRSPPCAAVEASVETVFATSSQVLPPPMSRNAASIFVRAAAICAAVGSVASASTSGATSITQAWRVSGVVASLSEPGVDIGLGDGDALGGREVLLDAAVDDALQRDRGQLLGLLLDELRLLLGLCLGRAGRRPSGWRSGSSPARVATAR